MTAYILVLYIYAGALARGDSTSMVTVPMTTLEACKAAGAQAAPLVDGSAKTLRFACLKT